jgi:hypothetical protein
MTGRVLSRDVLVAATAESLCHTYKRHKPPTVQDGFHACDACRRNADLWVGWVERGRSLAELRYADQEARHGDG